MAVTFRAASDGQSSTAATSASVTQPAGATVGDLVLVAVIAKDSQTFHAASGWTLSSADLNGAAIPFTTAVYWKVLVGGETWPIAFSWTGSSVKFAWNALAFTPGAGLTMAVDGEAAVKVDTTGATTHTANSKTAVAASVCSVILNCGRRTASSTTGATVTPPSTTPYTEPSNGDITTASGNTTALAQLGAESCYRTGQSGTVTPSAATWSQTVAANVYHFLLKDQTPAVSVTAIKATGTGTARRPEELSPPLELSGFGTFTGVGSSDTINTVTVTVSEFASAAAMGAPSIELWDYSGTPARIGSPQNGTTSVSDTNVDTATFTGVTYGMLATLRLRIYARQGTAPAGALQNVNWAGLTVSYTPSSGGNAAATLATGTGAAQTARAAAGVTAVLASGTGTARAPAAAVSAAAVQATGAGAALNATAQTSAAATATAVLPSGTGAAQSPAGAVSVPAAKATGTGAAQGATPAAGVNAAAATGTGTAQAPAEAVAVNAGLASGAGTAPGATAQTSAGTTVNAAPATGAGAAQSPLAAISVTAALASGAGAALNVTPGTAARRLFPATNGPASPVSYSGNFLAGVIFKVTQGGMWFQGYYKWVAAGGDTVARKFALWQVNGAGTGVLLPAATVTSGTLTAGQWNFVPLTVPVPLAIGTAYNACTGWTAVAGFEDSDTGGAGTGAGDSFGAGGHTAGITQGPLFAFSDEPGASGTKGEPYGTPQGVFSTAGTDPAVTMPAGGSNSGNFWVDVQVSDTGPSGYTGPYRLWPGKADTNNLTGTDSPVNYDISTEFALSQPCTLDKVWYYSPPGTAQLATSANVWNITGGGLTGTLAAQASSPSWSGAAASGWVSCSFTGVTLPPGKYKVSVYNNAATPDNWGAKDANTDYWRGGEGGNGITWGPLSAPNLSGASLAYNYDGSAGGSTPPFTDGTTLPGQPTFTQGPPDAYPYLFAAVTSPAAGSTQNYWIDAEVTLAPVNAGLASGAGTAPGATPAVAVNAAPATGTGTALNATATPAASVTAILATGTGAALNATASTSSSGSANAAAAAGTGTARNPAAAVAVNAAAATGTGAALNATASTAAFTSASAGLASGTGTAQQPGLVLAAIIPAAAATGTGGAQATPGAGVRTAAATGTGTARGASPAAAAGLASGTGAAQPSAAALAYAARAQAATALAAALNITIPPPPPVYGTARQATLTIPHAEAGQVVLARAEGGQP